MNTKVHTKTESEPLKSTTNATFLGEGWGRRRCEKDERKNKKQEMKKNEQRGNKHKETGGEKDRNR